MRRLFWLAVFPLGACDISSLNPVPCEESRTCPFVDSGTNDGESDATSDGPSVDAPGCDLSADPKDAPKCVDSGVGIFVDSSKSDLNDGSRATPVATIGHALALAKTKSVRRIYVCEGTYAEDVLLMQNTSIYGGFKCGDWSYTGNKPVVGKTQLAMKLDGVNNVVIEDLEADAKDADGTNRNSIGALINASTGVTLKRVKLTAGRGNDGTNGTASSNYTPVAQNDMSIAGKNASGIVGGAPHVCALCTDTKNSVGGAGGTGGSAPSDGSDGSPNLNGVNPIDGKKGHAKPSVDCTGHDGPNGGAGSPAGAPTALATLTTSWTPANGAPGTNGGVAQGGGGGGGGTDNTNLLGGAGGGGCGGCGGGLGNGGTGGGASLGLLSVQSTVTLTASEVITRQAGNGGAGAAGQVGQPGGFTGQASIPGCFGGTGGTGGAGGSGSGGAGGISVPVVYKGTLPTMDSATTSKLVAGTKGLKGTGGTPAVNDGPDGLSQPTFECKAPLCN